MSFLILGLLSDKQYRVYLAPDQVYRKHNRLDYRTHSAQK